MRYFITFLTLLTFSLGAAAAETTKSETKKEETPVCVKTDDLIKIMNDKGYFHLLNMTNKNDVIETVWVAGTSVAITAQDKDTSCIIAMMKDVVYNPNTLEGLLKAYQKQTNQKDI